MSTQNSRTPKIIATVNSILLIVALILLTVVLGHNMRHNSRLADKIKKEKLAFETSLSERLQLEKELDKTKIEFQNLSDKKDELERALTSVTYNLKDKDTELKAATNQANSTIQSKKKYNDLLVQKEQLQKQVLSYQNELMGFRGFNEQVNMTLAGLEENNKNLSDQINTLQMSSMNNILIETIKRNGDLTIKSKRTKRISVDLEVPTLAQNVKFTILDPSGKELATNENNIKSKALVQNNNKSQPFYTVSNHQGASLKIEYRKIQMSYDSKEKLKPGTYTIIVTNDGMSIGSLQVRLI